MIIQAIYIDNPILRVACPLGFLHRKMASDSVSGVSELRWVRGSSVNERKFIRELEEINLRGFLSDTERKNMEAIALELRGPEAVRGLQCLLN